MLIIFVQYRIVIQLPGREKAKSIFMFLKISNLCACVCKLILFVPSVNQVFCP